MYRYGGWEVVFRCNLLSLLRFDVSCCAQSCILITAANRSYLTSRSAFLVFILFTVRDLWCGCWKTGGVVCMDAGRQISFPSEIPTIVSLRDRCKLFW